MTEKQKLLIDFGKLGGPVFVGRTKGERVRAKYLLDDVDANENVEVSVIVPPNTFSINPSFFLAMFGGSIRSAGNKDKFLEKFKISAPEHIMQTIERSIARALHEKGVLLKDD